ncbi:MAG: DUF1501 domain-containing protein, partial [Planctomycetota bacterium]|nr:DUF1501 domain-containing protein [Planctomycetota bacterium]
DPKMSAPVEYRSTVGEVSTSLPGVTIGGLFPNMARVAEHMVFVRSFAHGNSGHSGGTHWVMTGYNHPPADSGEAPIKPSFGSIAARTRGASNRHSGIPTYVRLQGTYADGAAWLGSAYSPFDSGGEARQNMELRTDGARFSDRRGLLKTLDRMERRVDRSGAMEGLDSFEKQAFEVVLGRSKEAYDLNREDPRTRDRYGSGLGQNLLLARRLCEAGCGFVSIHYGGWDMHGGIEAALQGRCPEMDRAVAAFVDDVAQRGLSKNILLVITGEFGRTPRINGGAGRDHWAPLSTLALAHGRINNGLVVGESSDKVEVPKSAPIGPQDLMATVFYHLGIDQKLHLTDAAGRPTPMITGGSVLAGLS